jgi:hypothetical protein
MFPATTRLRPSYLATAYIVLLPGRPATLRIGRHAPPLPWGTCRHAAFVTAANPEGRPRLPGANLRANRCLEAQLRAAGLRHYPGIGAADDGVWPAEPSLLIFGLARRIAAALGRRLRQNAILHLSQSRHVTLVPLR